MVDDRVVPLETMRKAIADSDADSLREGVKVLAETVMEAEVTELTGVSHGEDDPERRLTRRNGYRASGAGTRAWARSTWPCRARRRHLLPEPARTPSPRRASVPRGRPGSRAALGAGHGGDDHPPHLRAARRGGYPGAAARGGPGRSASSRTGPRSSAWWA